ncbi:MAG: hypothetical protein ABSC13_08315 [Dehalococcoidia bacterium]|jgi:hypothetical protein
MSEDEFPRETLVHERLNEQDKVDFAAALRHPDVQDAFADALEATLAEDAALDDQRAEANEGRRLRMVRLVHDVREAAPSLSKRWGPHLYGLLLQKVLFHAYSERFPNLDADTIVRKVGETAGRLRTEHLSADNPITKDKDGNARVPPEATEKHRFELRDYDASMRPAGKVGRPQNIPKPKGSGQPPISEEKAWDTDALALPAWAAKWAPELDLTNPADAHKARARFSRARDVCNRLKRYKESHG